MQQEVLLMQAQVEQMLFERDLTEAKVWAERAKVSDNPSLSTPPTTLKGLIGGQLTKISNEGALLLKKGITEDAQTKSGIAATDSIVGRQNALYAKQTDGFDRDAEQKFGKILADSYAVRRSTNDTEPQPPGMADGDIERIMDLMWNKVNN